MLIILCINHIVLAYRREGVAPPPPVHFEPLAERAARGPAAVGGVQGVAATLCRYVYSSHNRLSFVTVLIVLLQGEGFMRWYLSPYRHPPSVAVKPTKLACLRRAEGHKDGSALTHTLIVSLCAGRGSCRTVPPIPRTLWRAWWSTPPCGSEAHRAAQMVSVYSYSINIACAFTLLVVPGRMFCHPSLW